MNFNGPTLWVKDIFFNVSYPVFMYIVYHYLEIFFFLQLQLYKMYELLKDSC